MSDVTRDAKNKSHREDTKKIEKISK